MPLLILQNQLSTKSGVATTSSGLLAEDGDFLITESGNFIVLE